jgi:hypothetical protein
MQQQEGDRIKDEPFINIRKLVALDIVFHGPKLILAEFALVVGLCGALGAWSLFSFFHSPDHPLFTVILGLVLSWIALNYVPLLLYALSFMRHKNAELEVVVELAHKERYARKYMAQSLLLAVPFVVPILAIVQEWQKHSSSQTSLS